SAPHNEYAGGHMHATSRSTNLKHAIRSIPEGEPFSLLGDMTAEGGAMAGVIRVHDDRPAGSWECHPAGEELLVLLDGRATMTVRGPDGSTRDHELAAGDVLLIPRAQPHSARLHTPHIDVLF